ncbi:MAG TPA: helix-turn-helix domain-containing protein [Microlunatus sp.]
MGRSRALAPVVAADAEVLPLLLTTVEVARVCRVHPSTVLRWRQVGEGPPVIWVSSHIPRYARTQVVAWLERVGS